MMTKPTRIAVLMGSLGLFGTLPAGATVIVDGLKAYAESAAGSETHVAGPNTTTPMASAYSGATDNIGYAWSSAWGMTNGVYGVGAGVDGYTFGRGEFTRTWEITNTTGVAQSYSFSFYIYGGSMYADDYGHGGDGFAEYVLDILFGGNNLFHSAAKVELDGTLTQTGTALSGASQSGSYYWWGGTSVTLDLGILDPGQTSVLQYDLIAHAFGDYGFGTCDDGYGYGGQTANVAGVSAVGQSCTGNSYVFMGDPSGINATPVQQPSITATPQQVSAPGTLGLLGISLAALMAVRRRARVA